MSAVSPLHSLHVEYAPIDTSSYAHSQDLPEYYAMGHDVAEMIIENWYQRLHEADDDVSYLLCGSGDGRHLYHTLSTLYVMDDLRRQHEGAGFARVYIAVNDLNATAKSLVVFRLLYNYNSCRVDDEPTMTVVTYVLSSAIVPPHIETELAAVIADLIIDLQIDEDKDSPATYIFETFYVPRETRQQILRKLRQWSKPLQGNQYSTAAVGSSNTRQDAALAEQNEAHVLDQRGEGGGVPHPERCT